MMTDVPARAATSDLVKGRLKALIVRVAGLNGLNRARKARRCLSTAWGRWIRTPLRLKQNASREHRFLEIGPGGRRMPGFETLDVLGGRDVDYVADASKRLPFPDSTFEIVYASHVLEHMPWYEAEAVVREWVRVTKSGGRIEIWVPNALKVCEALLQVEKGDLVHPPDDWRVLNPGDDPYVWAAGHLFYGAKPGYPSWHRALFTPRYLKLVLTRCGLSNVRELDRSEVRGYDHGWINMGMVGVKP